MAEHLPDRYEETRRRLGIVNVLDSTPYEPGDPMLVRQSRKLDRKLKQSPRLLAAAKRALPLIRKAKSTSGKLRNAGKKFVPATPAKSSEVAVDTGPIELPAHPATPDVSIIIPVFNKVAVTTNCLRSLTKLNTERTYEVVIVDNASSDSTEEQLSVLPNLHYIRNAENMGFVDGCNIGAQEATGKILIFLNNDTEVTTTWLDRLVDPLDDPHIGLVGSKLLYPNGTLQEAGGIIFKDGTGLNYGKHQLADYFTFNYRRDVDYCSGASVAIHTELFRELGGFDKRFAPAYYEDTDLAFQVRAKGLRVIYEPSSVAYHIEGETAGTDINSGFKRFQAINHKKFVKKWGQVLERNHVLPEEWYLGRDRSGDKLALVIDDRVPTPDKDSGSQRMVRLITDLQSLGYKVTFWPRNLQHEGRYTEQLQTQGVEVVYGDVDFISFATRFGRYYDLVLLSRPYNAASYLEACRAWFYRAALVYDTVDLHFLRTERQAKADPKNYDGLMDQSRGYQELEIGLARRTDATLVVSEAEKEIVESLDPSIHVSVVSNIHELVNDAYKNGYHERKNLVFIGGFDHLPNQDAIKWFAKEIMPLLRKQIPGLTLQVVGANMSAGLARTLSAVPGIEVLGYVEDISEIFTRARIFVCPLRYGAGVKGKIGQAIEYGIPVVSTDIGVEGMHLKDGTSCLVANDTEEFVAAVKKLYTDESLWDSVRSEAKKVLQKHFSHESARQGLAVVVKAASKQ